MAKYQAGTKVIRVDTQKKGVISSVSDYIRGRQLSLVNGGDYESEELETELIEDCDITNVFERCKRGLFGSYAEFAQKNTSSKIKSSNNSTISSLKASMLPWRCLTNCTISLTRSSILWQPISMYSVSFSLIVFISSFISLPNSFRLP